MAKDHEHLPIPDAVRVRMMEIARELRRAETTGEKMLWHRLRGRRSRGRKFRRQQPIGPFVVDFFCGDELLAVEVDGGVHASQLSADRERQDILESLGYRFVRLDDALVRTDIEEALRLIEASSSVQAPPLRLTERGTGGEVLS